MKISENSSDIPTSWKWVRITDIGKVITGTTPAKSQKDFYGGNVPFFKPTELDNVYYVKSASEKLTTEGLPS